MNEQLDIERAERDGCRFFYGGEWNDGVFVGWAAGRGGATVAVVKYRESGGMVVVVRGDIRNIPAAEPPPVEHVHYCGGVLIHTRDGVPVAYTKDGVRVEVVPADNVRQMKRLTKMVWQKKLDEAEDTIESLLDGLDANYDPERCGLSSDEWDRRIRFARAVVTRTYTSKKGATVLIHTADGVPVAYTKDGVRVEVAMVGDWTCAACQFTISGVHQIVTDDGPTDEWQIPPCEHCAAAASQELAEAEADRDDAHRRIDLAKADYEGLLKAATKWKGHYDEAVVEIERMRQRVLNSARTREDGMIEQFEAFKAKVLAKSHKIIHRLLLPNISKGLDASYELAALCQPAKRNALDGEATDG